MSALDILEAAAGHMKDRAATYDKPAGERSMGATVAAFKAITGISMTEEQGWLFMGVLKQVRTQQGGWRADNYEDGAAYFALQGEAAERDRGRAAGDDFDEQRMDAIGQNGNDGLHYSEVHGNSHVPAEDMTDPRNWRAGDWIEAVSSSGNGYEAGELYMVKSVKGNSVSTVLDRKGSKENGWLTKWFRFHARPDAEGWIKWKGGECPVGGGVDVEYVMRADHGFRGLFEKASGLRWKHDGSGGDIIAYRPHLATKQDKG